jgi:hypothetical protein
MLAGRLILTMASISLTGKTTGRARSRSSSLLLETNNDSTSPTRAWSTSRRNVSSSDSSGSSRSAIEKMSLRICSANERQSPIDIDWLRQNSPSVWSVSMIRVVINLRIISIEFFGCKYDDESNTHTQRERERQRERELVDAIQDRNRCNMIHTDTILAAWALVIRIPWAFAMRPLKTFDRRCWYWVTRSESRRMS